MMGVCLGNTAQDMINKGKASIIVIIIGIILQLLASILLVFTATKDPATIPTRDFLYNVYKKR